MLKSQSVFFPILAQPSSSLGDVFCSGTGRRRVGNTGLDVLIMMVRWKDTGCQQRDGLQIEKLDGKLLVCSEQGVGDEILYLSCLPDLLKQHKAIVVECDKRWGPIFRRSFPEIIVVPRQVKFVGEDNLFYDYSEITRKYKIGAYVLCGDLPKIFRYDLKTPKNGSGFLRSNPQRRQIYTKYLDKRPGQIIVGVCWKSGFAPSWPSIYPRLGDLLEFLPNDKNLRLISLQYGPNDSPPLQKVEN